MLGQTLAIARNTFREAVRDRVLYNLILFALLLIGSAIFIGELSAGQEAKIVVDLGLSAMLLFGAFIAIFVGVGLVYKEIERRTLYAILSKPIGRGQFYDRKALDESDRFRTQASFAIDTPGNGRRKKTVATRHSRDCWP